jgi:sec-independent protein translocase protein TatA
MDPLFGFFEGAFAPSHIILVLIVGVLLFGKRLPEVGRSLGKGLMEFKKGLHGLEDEFRGATMSQEPAPQQFPQMPQVPQRVVPPTQVPNQLTTNPTGSVPTPPNV